MIIDVSDLFRRRFVRKDINLVVEDEGLFSEYEDVKVSNPITINGAISLVGDILCLDAQIKADFIFQCSRCLEDFEYTVDITVHEEFTNDVENKDDTIIFVDGDAIDITAIIENNIMMALPIKKLCNENCKGLCQRCGANLNISTCTCGNDVVDPRFAQLKEFFTTN